MVSDNGPGLETFFTPGEEILLPTDTKDVVRLLTDVPATELEKVGRRAQERVLAEHTGDKRAQQFEDYVVSCRTSDTASTAFSALTAL